MALRLRITALAVRDIKRIGRYSRRQWGVQVAIRYILELWRAIERSVRLPTIGADCSDVLPGVRRYRFRSHTIYYVVDSDSVRILRILHMRMSPRRHL
jgi:toxin ParE1/3/4